jgi:hypothetical protein
MTSVIGVWPARQCARKASRDLRLPSGPRWRKNPAPGQEDDDMQQGAVVSLISLLVTAGAARADQLAWLTPAQAESAVEALPAGAVVVSYCSLCEARPEVWVVKRASAEPAGDDKHHKVVVEGWRLARSREAFAAGSYREPVEYESLPARVVREEMDLAYLYVRQGERYRALGHVLGLPCETRVPELGVPESATVPTAAGSAAVALHVSAGMGRDAQDSAGDIRRAVESKRAESFALVDDPAAAEATVHVTGRRITKGQGVDATGTMVAKDFYEIVARVAVLGEGEELHSSQEFLSVAPWRDSAQAFVGILDQHVEARLHGVLQARYGFPELGGRIEEMDDGWRTRLGARKAKGAAFVSVDPGGPAEAAGIRPGDVIVEIDGKKTKHAWDVARLVWRRGAGAPLRLKLKRENAERVAILTPGPSTLPSGSH